MLGVPRHDGAELRSRSPFGQAISRTTYAALSRWLGTHLRRRRRLDHVQPDRLARPGVAGKDDMGGAAGRITAGGSGSTGTTLGTAGGAETVTLTTAQLASHTHANVLNDLGHTHNGTTGGASADHTHTFSGTTSTESADHTHQSSINSGSSNASTGASLGVYMTSAGSPNPLTSGGVSANHTHTYSGTTSGISADHTHNFSTGSNTTVPMSLTNAAAGSGNAHNNMPPTMMVNFILRVL